MHWWQQLKLPPALRDCSDGTCKQVPYSIACLVTARMHTTGYWGTAMTLLALSWHWIQANVPSHVFELLDFFISRDKKLPHPVTSGSLMANEKLQEELDLSHPASSVGTVAPRANVLMR